MGNSRTSSARKSARQRAAAKPVKTGRMVAERMVGLKFRRLDQLVAHVAHASPTQLVEVERRGVDGPVLKDMSTRLGIPQVQVFRMLGVRKAMGEQKITKGQILSGSGGHAAIGMAKLMARVQEIVDNSTADEAHGFDTARWLGRWLGTPQPALGGRTPSEMLDTPTGQEVVQRLLGALESGAYQ